MAGPLPHKVREIFTARIFEAGVAEDMWKDKSQLFWKKKKKRQNIHKREALNGRTFVECQN